MKAILYFPDYTFDISDINEDMEQSSAVNPVEADADFYIGVSSKSEIKFSLNNLYQLISENSLANKEFLLQRGKPTKYNNVFDIYKKIRKPLFVQQGGFTFAGNDRAPYLSIYNSDLVLQSAPAQPLQPVKSLLIIGSKLYCVHDKEPYLTAYAVSGGVLTLQPQVTLTDFYKNKLLGYAKNKRCFNKQGNTVTEYVSIYTDMKVSDVIAETWGYKNFGYYTVKKAEKINDTKISVIAYDRMGKFEILADEFLDSVTYPISLKSLLTKLCAFVGVSFKNRTLLNENYSVPRNFKTEGVTCKQVLQWIAQIAANFAYIDFDGNLNISWYTEMDSQINANNSTVIDIADYVVQPIQKVRVRAFQTDIGVAYPGTKQSNIYVIENNPLLYATEESQIKQQVINIYNAIKGFSYIPFTAKIRVVDEDVRSGSVISATTVKETNFKAHVMQSTLKGITGLYAEYSATGNEFRKTEIDVVNQRIEVLNRRTNSLVFDLEKTENTLTTVSSDVKKVTDDVTGITQDVETITTEVGALKLTSSQLDVKLSKTETKLGETTEKVTHLSLSTEGLSLAVQNGKLKFDENGLSTYGGGFKMYTEDGADEIFSVTGSGYLKVTGSIELYSENMNCGRISPYYSQTYGSIITISSDEINLSGLIRSIETSSFVFHWAGGRYRLRRQYVVEYDTYFATFSPDLDSLSAKSIFESDDLPPLSMKGVI